MGSLNNIEQVSRIIARTGKLDQSSFEGLSEEEQQIIKEFCGGDDVSGVLEFMDSLDLEADLERLKKDIAPIEQKGATRSKRKTWLKYAALFVGAIGSIYLFYFFKQPHTSLKEIPKDAITLTLDDGSVKVIQANGEQDVVLGSGQVVGSQEGDRLRYDAETTVEELVYNELYVPYGKLFAITLSDGTSVQLNSGTKLKYPVKFIEGKSREVFIDGEAYFDVAKDSLHPFLVYAESVAVEVLGTQFNLSSFREDANINTVLVEGSVKMFHKDNLGQSSILAPGQKGSWNRSDKAMSQHDVDIRLYTEWINGELIFRNASFQSIAKKLERRYDVSIQSDHRVLNNKKFNASFHVDIETIDEVLQAIDNICPLSYKKLGDGTIQISEQMEN